MTNKLAFIEAELRKGLERGDISPGIEYDNFRTALGWVPKREWPRRGARPEVWEAQKYVDGDPIVRVFRDPKRRPLRKPESR